MGDSNERSAETVGDRQSSDGHRERNRSQKQADLQRERDLTDRIIETSPTGIVVYDPNGTVVRTNGRAEEIVGRPEREMVGLTYEQWRYVDAAGNELPSDEHVFERALETGESVFGHEAALERTDGTRRWLSMSAALVTNDADEIERIVVVAEDITDRRERQHELERLDRINAIIRRTNRALVGAVRREEIETAVCERLTEPGGYAFAWISEPYPTDGTLEARTWAGGEDDYLDSIAITVDDAETARGPTSRALRSRAVETTSDVRSDPGFAPWREAAIEHDFRSSACVPLIYGETLYGLLNLYADRPNGFSEDEREVLGELGETIGYAINAIQSKRLLFTDQVTELEFESDSTASCFIDVCQRTGGEMALEGVVPSTEHADLYYVTLRRAPPDAVLSGLAEVPGIEGRVVAERESDWRLEFLVGDGSITRALLEQGARVKEATIEDGTARITAEVTPTADVRAIVESITEAFPGSELLAKYDIERREQTTHEFRAIVDDALTDRQTAALKAAFYTGYFDWPRASSAEAVAATMDIAAPTFHQHLRAAHRKLLTAFFEN